jgi:hypothetical protein
MDDPIEVAAQFIATQGDGPERLLAIHTRRDCGACNGCGVYRPITWPCVLVAIGERALEIRRRTTITVVSPRSAAGADQPGR